MSPTPAQSFLSTQFRPKYSFDLAASQDLSKPMELSVVIMRAGISADGQYFFPADVLQRDGAPALADAKMYVNHPDFIDNMSNGRDVRKYVSILRNVAWDSTQQALVGKAVVFERGWRQHLNDMAAAEVLDTMDLSVYVAWDREVRKKDGVQVMTAMKPHPTNSLDYVYVANAGGAVQSRLAASMQNKEKEIMDEKEVQAKIDAALKPVQDQLAQALKLAEDEKTSRIAAEEKVNLAAAEKALDEKLSASKLPEPAVAFLKAKFSGKSDISALDAEIKLALDLQTSVSKTAPEKKEKTETPGVLGLGDASLSQSRPSGDDNRKALIESFKKQFIANGVPEALAQSRAEARVSGLKSA